MNSAKKPECGKLSFTDIIGKDKPAQGDCTSKGQSKSKAVQKPLFDESVGSLMCRERLIYYKSEAKVC